ncbi:MAG: DUF4845 domain-containing protein [Gammaproteobacteria bacterium]
MTMWQWLVVILVAGLGLTVAVAIGPIYLSNFTVQSTVKDLRADRELGGKSVVEIRQAIERRFDVNSIAVIQAVCRDPATPCLKIEKTKSTLKVDANYEARTHVIANIDAVVVFKDNVVEIPLPGGP